MNRTSSKKRGGASISKTHDRCLRLFFRRLIMDVQELLSYQPASIVDEDGNGSTRKKKKMEGSPITDLDLDSLIKDGPPPLDESGVKKLLLNFERKILKNQELRVKFSENPSKFMDSEVELFDVLQEMHVISTQPELYRVVVDMNCVSSLLGILSHENSDVSCAAVNLIQELTDLDNIDEMEEVSFLLNALIDQQVIALLVSNMERLDEEVKEESEGVYNSLAIIENLTDFNPDLSKDCQPLIQWILKRIQSKIPFNSNKLYASEILSILVQNNEENRKTLGTLGGIDVLLRQISVYKKQDPSSLDEHEYMENLFNSLCSALLSSQDNRRLFYEGEGLELMNLILKEKRHDQINSSSTVKMGSLKVIAHVMSSDKGVDDVLKNCCTKFVDILGLRVLFPIFLQPKSIIGGKVKKKELPALVDSIEEQTLTILVALLRFADKGEQQRRIVTKFVESEFEKTERLLELHFKYYERLSKIDSKIRKEKARRRLEEEDDDEEDEEEFFIQRLTEGGLFPLQLTDQVILLASTLYQEFFALEHPDRETVRMRLDKLLKMRGSTSSADHIKVMTNIIAELRDHLPEEETDEKTRLTALIDDFSKIR